MLSGVVTAILTGFAERTIAGIRSKIPNVTGKMSQSLGYKIDESGLTIFSTEKYFTILETGRGPGKRPPISAIEDWVKNKPIASDINPRSLAFLIARKIGEEGSLLYRQGGKSGVISDFINETKIQEDLINLLTDEFRDYVINEFINKAVNGSN
jgi:hypothetical protein